MEKQRSKESIAYSDSNLNLFIDAFFRGSIFIINKQVDLMITNDGYLSYRLPNDCLSMIIYSDGEIWKRTDG